MARRTWSTALAGVLLVGVTALPSTAADASPSTPGPAASPSRATLTTAQFESRVLALVNARRKKVGCAQLKSHTALAKAARAHSTLMAKKRSLSHKLPGELGMVARIVKAGYKKWTAISENIAWAARVPNPAPTPARIYTLWMNSSPHRANIQNCTYRDAGVGVVRAASGTWVTLDFGRHR